MSYDAFSSHQLGRVFVSSVFRNFREYREAAGAMTELLGLEPVLTEDQTAQPTSVRERLEQELDASDIYLGMFGKARGTKPTRSELAITEHELVYARQRGLRSLVFVGREDERDPELESFLDVHVRDWERGLWQRPYSSAAELRREIAGGLAPLRPRLVLELIRAQGGGLIAQLDLHGVCPAWTGAARIGSEPIELVLSTGAESVLHAFLRGQETRVRLPEDALIVLGAELWSRALPGAIGVAAAAVLERARRRGQLLVLEIRTDDSDALALPWELLQPPGDLLLPVRQGALEVIRSLGAAHSAPALPSTRLTILGFTASPLEDAAGGAGQGWAPLVEDTVLDWENEQDKLLRALDPLVAAGRGRLALPDTGASNELRAWLTGEEAARIADRPAVAAAGGRERPEVVHLSCHGGLFAKEGVEPHHVVWLEDDEGRRDPVAAERLLEWYRASSFPGLTVLSACYTAAYARRREDARSAGGRSADAAERADKMAPARVAAESRTGSFAEALVRGGAPRVLGMQTSVSDQGAIAMAERFYGSLAAGADLVRALQAGREALRASSSEHEWAIPSLLVRTGYGPLVAPASEQTSPALSPLMLAAEHFKIAEVEYLRDGYVGRRDFERRLWSAWKNGAAVMVIHGLGGMGKSTLAARFASRRQRDGVRLLIPAPGAREAATLFDEVAKLVGVERPPLAPDAEDVFRRALSAELGSKPSLLLLDNFEDNQLEDGAFRDRELGEKLEDLAALGGDRFRVLITSRLPVALGPSVGCENLDLGELPPSSARKMRLSRPGLKALSETSWRTALDNLGGHPKALDLLDRYIRAESGRAEAFLARLQHALEKVEADLAHKKQRRGHALLVEEVLSAVPIEHLPALDRLCLLEVPLPQNELVALLEGDGVVAPQDSLAWLRSRGLLARTTAASAIEGGDAVHRLLARHRDDALADREGVERASAWHRRLADHFVQRKGPLSDFGVAAGHLDRAGDRAGALELYDRWALELRGAHAYRACAELAERGLQRFAADAREETRVEAASLHVSVHDGWNALGERARAGVALDQARRLLQGLESRGADFQLGSVELRVGQRSREVGDIEQAESAFRRAASHFSAAGDERDRAIALGNQADVLFARGELDEALRIRRDEELPVFERLGDVRSRAVTWGKIADVLFARGELDEALRIRRDEELPVFERLGDVRSRAMTWGQIADVLFARGELDEALRIRRDEQLPVFERLGDVRSRAVTWGQIADVLFARGELDEALRIRRDEQLPVFERLGDVRSRAVAWGKIADVLFARGELDEALRIWRDEELPVYDQLGDVAGRAGALFAIAQIALTQRDVPSALPRLAEAFAIFERLGRADGLAAVGGLLGQILLAMKHPHARSVLEKARAACVRLGRSADAAEIDALLAGDPSTSPQGS